MQVGVHRLDVTGRDQPQGRVAGGRDRVVLTGAHQLHRLVGGAEGLDRDLAAGLLLEVARPSRPRGRCCRPRRSPARPGRSPCPRGSRACRAALRSGTLNPPAPVDVSRPRAGAATGREGEGGHGREAAIRRLVMSLLMLCSFLSCGTGVGDQAGLSACVAVVRLVGDGDDVVGVPGELHLVAPAAARRGGRADPFCCKATSRGPAVEVDDVAGDRAGIHDLGERCRRRRSAPCAALAPRRDAR